MAIFLFALMDYNFILNLCQIVRALIKAGSILDLKEKSQQLTSLHEAIIQHYTEAALLLIESGTTYLKLVSMSLHLQSIYNYRIFCVIERN